MIKRKDFFSKITLKSAYWAGFIAADGYISVKTNQVGISLSGKDEKHLLKLAKELNIKMRKRFRTTSLSPNKIRPFVEISFSNKEIKDSLKEIYNLGPNKSLTLGPPNFKLLKRKFIKAYLKGLIDGDGAIMLKYRGNAVYLRFKIVGSYDIVSWVKFFIENTYKIETNTKVRPKKNIWEFEIVGKPAEILIKDLHKVKTPELKRKWDKLKKVKR